MYVDLQSWVLRLLQTCNTHNSIPLGKQLHALLLKNGLLYSSLHTFTNRILQMYTKCGSLNDACKLFDEMPERNSFSWNTLLQGYMNTGHKEKALELFNFMPCKNEFSWNLVVLGYVKAGEVGTAQGLFDAMPRKNAKVWNSMIKGYARSSSPGEAIWLFKELSSNPLEMSCCDSFVLATVVGACSDMVALECGRQIHVRIVVDGVDVDSVLGSSLVNLYGKCGDVDSAENVLNGMKEADDFSLSALISGFANCGRMNDAKRLFYRKRDPCIVLWNSMLAGYVSNNMGLEAFVLFSEMRRNGFFGDFSTFASVLSACSNLGILVCSKQLHAYACKVGAVDDIIVASAFVDAYYKCGVPDDAFNLFNELAVCDTVLLNSMITIYSGCGRIEDAKRIFKTMPYKNLISWNSMIVSLSQNGYPVEALDLFCEMNRMDLRMDNTTLASVISSCGSVSSLELGEQVFARAVIIGLKSDQAVSTSLVDFYCKCGFVEEGRKLFEEMTKCDEISWNSMLTGYATNGYGDEALTLFNDMKLAGVRPTEITFTAVLSACNHCGLVEEGRKWFSAMSDDYHIDKRIEHYSCMVDLFSRAGCLDEAMDLIEQMPFTVDASMWSSVLRGCVAHGNKNLGKMVAERIIELDPENSGAYIQLSSILASTGSWDQSALVRKIMREKHVDKIPGFSRAQC